uniref:Cysteine-rich protein n=2 Tax=Hyaloperonospora arabidopsidis TaxID=272952 RepID=M4BPW2_HYAAE|nr:cysteine-rich protein [Hyaloperonospora arabidopsidis]
MQNLISTLSTVAVAVALANAEQEVSLKIHVGQTKFRVTPLGQQCAFNNCVDPQLYPCANSVCMRLNYTFGNCSLDKGVKQDYNDVKFLCPYPNPYSPKLGVLSDVEQDEDENEDEDN